VITVLTVDAALEHICVIFREQADRGDITPTERDLLIDGAILLANYIDDLDRAGRVGSHSGWPDGAATGTGWTARTTGDRGSRLN